MPLAVVNAPILPGKDAVALSLIRLEVSFVLLAILPCQRALTMHFILKPFAHKGLTIGPNVLARA